MCFWHGLDGGPPPPLDGAFAGLPLHWTVQNFALFSLPSQLSFFLLCGSGAGTRTNRPQRSPHAHFGWAMASTRGPQFHKKTSKIRGGRMENKPRNFGRPTLRAPLLLGLGPHSSGPHSSGTTFAGFGVPNFGRPTLRAPLFFWVWAPHLIFECGRLSLFQRRTTVSLNSGISERRGEMDAVRPFVFFYDLRRRRRGSASTVAHHRHWNVYDLKKSPRTAEDRRDNTSF